MLYILRCYYPQKSTLKLAIGRYIEFHWYGCSALWNLESSYQGLKNIRNIMTYVSLRIDRWMTVIFVLRRVNVRKMLFLGILWTYINSVYFVIPIMALLLWNWKKYYMSQIIHYIRYAISTPLILKQIINKYLMASLDLDEISKAVASMISRKFVIKFYCFINVV